MTNHSNPYNTLCPLAVYWTRRKFLDNNATLRVLMNNAITLKYLSEVPDVIPVLAQWLLDEFHYLIPGKTIDYVIESLHARLNTDRIPLCITAFNKNELIGPVSLKISDMDIRENLSPWLAGLFVKINYRKNGVGTYLVKSIEEIAKQMGVKELYLYTPSAWDFYTHIGWYHYEDVHYKSKDVVIMNKFL